MSTSSVSRYVDIYSFTIPPSSFLSILRFLSSFYQTSVVYQLQRRVRTLREQLQRRDLHLDLLRRKLSLQEESVKMKSLLQNERDEACLRYVHCHIFYALHSILFRYVCAYIYIYRSWIIGSFSGRRSCRSKRIVCRRKFWRRDRGIES